MKIRLSEIAHARSGDKADRADIGLFAWDATGYALIEEGLTSERVAAHFAHLLARPGVQSVERYPLPRLLAIKWVLNGALGGGAASSLRSDNLGKTLGALMLRMTLEVDEARGQAALAAARAASA
ncbi:MAG: hypothetical protein ACKODC_04690 [Limnohabitans sp.]